MASLAELSRLMDSSRAMVNLIESSILLMEAGKMMYVRYCPAIGVAKALSRITIASNPLVEPLQAKPTAKRILVDLLMADTKNLLVNSRLTVNPLMILMAE